MYFKKLEITGFKSFAEKTTLFFEPGVTAVVGPNGCGKSNIIDAIKWVLGEQSVKSLRGSKMEDVIFNGTEEKEPINMAEVSLTLSNKDKLLPIDTKDAVISRKIFRSGESEYYLNKTPVRLKDIQELLMGTGIGASMYSIVEQGKIGLILSSRPEERRYIFEEASGITKYKAKKREAVRRLEATDSNLLRVNDIISEVRRQINSITRQARKAERYKERFDRLKELEINLSSYEYRLLTDDINSVSEEARRAKAEIETLNAGIEHLRSELDDKKESFARIDERHSQLKNEKISKESTVEQSKNKIVVDRERITELSARVDESTSEIGKIEVRRDSAKRNLEELDNRLAAVTDSEETKKEFLSDKEKALADIESSITNNEKMLNESKEKIVDFMHERSKSRNEVVRLTSDIQNKSARLRRLDTELDKVDQETVSVQEKLVDAKKGFEGTELRLNNIRNERDRLIREKETLYSSLEKIEGELQEKRDSMISLESKRSFLEDLIERQEGFSSGAKEILRLMKEEDPRTVGIKGVLGNLIEVSSGYEIVVETVLGEYVQSVVVDSRNNANELANYLGDTRKGKATFIILDEIYVDTHKAGADTSGGDFPTLAGFVRVDDSLKGVMENLLRDIYVCDTMDTAVSALREGPNALNKGVRFATRRGEIIGNGLLSAGSGSRGEDSIIIGRASRLKNVENDIDSLKGGIELAEDERDNKKRAHSKICNKLANVEDLLREEEVEYHRRENILNSAEQEYGKLQDERSLLKLERDEVNDEMNDFSSKKEELETRLKEIETSESETQSVIMSSQTSLKDLSKEREDIIVLVATINAEIQALSKEREGLVQNLGQAKESYDEYVRMLQQRTNDIETSNKKREELTQEIDELNVEIDKLTKELKEEEKDLIQVSQDKLNSSSVLKDLEIQLNEDYKKLNDVRDRDHNHEMRKTELKFKTETLKNRMEQLYKINIDTEIRDVDPSTDWDVTRREIEELNRKLEAMGTVNLVAIEEHKELEDRFNFLSQQHQDLMKAKEDLQKAIAKINKETRKMFIETFEKIKFEFKNYFRYLFGGGQAEIFLLDENDVLESGIEIVARPPGKKLQSITLLSGGEKALTAIALVFAIFKIKPSPFCLLDEVDAPLDESNIDRFSKALLEFTKRSQFIIITHNKNTITLADVMYGITMEKSGITKIVSVRFQDKAKEKSVAGGESADKEADLLTSTDSAEDLKESDKVSEPS
ncbi:MAG: chromosome segregation protein SMC [Candidatus Omnitrophica bacterium]|nr:chromosome segregation protein SMC [Candidatus Omnitrophota bacterium]